jgi:hypothetical protein
MKLINFGLCRCRHDARQIIRIREEAEDAGKRVWNPIFELKMKRHFSQIRKRSKPNFPQEIARAARNARKIEANKWRMNLDRKPNP